MNNQSGFAEVNGTRIYYETAGSGHPLVLIHGYTLDTRIWDDQFENFAQRYQVIRYDMRGFGKSSVPTDESYTHPDDMRATPGAPRDRTRPYPWSFYGWRNSNRFCPNVSGDC